MGTVNPDNITNDIGDPFFVRDSINFIRNKGIMTLGSGILKTHPTRSEQYVAVVLPEQTGADVPLDSLKAIMNSWEPKYSERGGYDIYFRSIPFASGHGSANQPEGQYDIDFVLAYNPSAPSLYLFNSPSEQPAITINDRWDNIRVHNEDPQDITDEIESKLGKPSRLTKEDWQSDNIMYAFKDTSIRLIFFLSGVNHPAAINYQEV